MSSQSELDKTEKATNKLNKRPSEILTEQGYKFGRILGEGSYCKVRYVTWGRLEMAAKIISRQHQSEDFVKRFLPREIEILRQVDHPNIIKVYRICDFPTHVYIFMELIERGDMLDYIRERGRLSEKEAHRYFCQLTGALQHLHSHNISHRDLKCENIMINSNDEIKIIDFGFCKRCVDTNGRRTLSKTYCGSTAYAAPEVLMGTPYNPMMYDVWSLGCVLFIMVTGSMPFDDTNVKEMVRNQLKRRLKFPGGSMLSHGVKNLIRRMLEPDVTKRANMDIVARSDWCKILPVRRAHDLSPNTQC